MRHNLCDGDGFPYAAGYALGEQGIYCGCGRLPNLSSPLLGCSGGYEYGAGCESARWETVENLWYGKATSLSYRVCLGLAGLASLAASLLGSYQVATHSPASWSS